MRNGSHYFSCWECDALTAEGVKMAGIVQETFSPGFSLWSREGILGYYVNQRRHVRSRKSIWSKYAKHIYSIDKAG
jgi:hypothetical protein